MTKSPARLPRSSWLPRRTSCALAAPTEVASAATPNSSAFRMALVLVLLAQRASGRAA